MPARPTSPRRLAEARSHVWSRSLRVHDAHLHPWRHQLQGAPLPIWRARPPASARPPPLHPPSQQTRQLRTLSYSGSTQMLVRGPSSSSAACEHLR
eukprot:6205816-Pleurochrysis_carterae.AAC.1